MGYEVVGIADGVKVRTAVGRPLGRQLGARVGVRDGVAVGAIVGKPVGRLLVGEALGFKGAKDTLGTAVGDLVGDFVFA